MDQSITPRSEICRGLETNMTASEEEDLIDSFLMAELGNCPSESVGSAERDVVDAVVSRVESHFTGSRKAKYVLGLAIDFAILAERVNKRTKSLRQFRAAYTLEDLFGEFDLVKSRGKTKANTLSLRVNGHEEGIRGIEERVLRFFHGASRDDYPSAYVYNTGQWSKYTETLVDAFRLSAAGRYELVFKLLRFGFDRLPRNVFFVRNQVRPRVFERVVSEYSTRSRGENSGLAFQAMVYGIMRIAYPHLSIVSAGVRTGSSRQRRFGDIDGYYGIDLEVSVEVKDQVLKSPLVDSHLISFCKQVEGNDVIGIVCCVGIDSACEVELRKFGVEPLTRVEMLGQIRFWDWARQNDALLHMLHYLAHIEQSAPAVVRLLKFIEQGDSKHDSLAHLEHWQQIIAAM